MIYIDFQGGAHGNYLEFVCNKFLGGVLTSTDPFNNLGASHNKQYFTPPKFKAGHYFSEKSIIKNSKIISIQITANDLLPLSSISLLRAGDYNIDNNQLEIDTYNKWNNIHYRWVLDNLISSFFQSQIEKSYNAVKDPSWPTINTIEDFKKLPNWIQEECLTQHNLILLELSSEFPNCPRYILREFFKLSFKYPDQAGFITQQQKMTYDNSNNIWIFPFACFYDTEAFIQELIKIAHWCGYNFLPNDAFYELHNKFLQRQIYKDSKKFCDQLLIKIFNNELFALPNLYLLQESYLTSRIELQYNVELPNTNAWFVHSREILNFVNSGQYKL
jgi:hypothetical protein